MISNVGPSLFFKGTSEVRDSYENKVSKNQRIIKQQNAIQNTNAPVQISSSQSNMQATSSQLNMQGKATGAVGQKLNVIA